MSKLVKVIALASISSRRETFEGRPHIVAPVVALVEGVHNGLYYPPNEIGKFVEAWNGIPLPVFHPEENGIPISANTPQLVEERSVGRLFNVHFESNGAKLVGEIWVDIAKARKVSPAILDALESGKKIEVSTALWTDGDGVAGKWHEEDFAQTVVNFRPDHLALLPGAVGACSIQDGCGVFANNQGEESIAAKAWHFLKSLVTRNEDISHEDLRYKLQQAINVLDNESWIHFIRDVYDNYFVYEARGSNPNEVGVMNSVSKLYKRDFSLNDNGDAAIADNPIEVREVRQYVPVTTQNAQEDLTMDRDKLIKSLIDCPHNGLTANDEKWMKELDDEHLKAMAYVEVEKEEEPPKKDEPPKENKPVTLDEYIANAPDEVKGVLNRAITRDKAIKAELVKTLLANKRNEFAEDQLKSKDIAELETLAKLGQSEVDYSLSRGNVTSNEDENAAPEPVPVFNFSEKKGE